MKTSRKEAKAAKTERPKITRIVIESVVLGADRSWVWKLYDAKKKNRYEGSATDLDTAMKDSREGVSQIQAGAIVI